MVTLLESFQINLNSIWFVSNGLKVVNPNFHKLAPYKVHNLSPTGDAGAEASCVHLII